MASRRLTLVLILVSCCFFAKGQNLLRNGGFEEFESLPNERGQVTFAIPWEPIVQSPDFFYAPLFSPIDNATGNGYFGVGLYSEFPSYEAFGQALQKELEADKNYFLNFNAAQLAGFSSFCLVVEIYGFVDAPLGNIPPDDHIKKDTTAIFLGAIEISSTSQEFRDYELCFSPKENINYFVFSAAESECGSYLYVDNFELYEVNDDRLFAPEISLCDGDTIVLGVDISYAEYMWQDGSTEAKYLVTEPGIYHLTIDTVCAKGVTDTVVVVNSGLGISEGFLGPDRILCNEESIEIVLPSRTEESLIYLNGVETNQLPDFSAEGEYQIRIENGDCIYDDAVLISKIECNECFVSFPNVFSPNGDGINDDFLASSNCNFISSRLSIFDRWGNKVSSSEGINIGWSAPTDIQSAVYTYLFVYEVEELGEVKEKRVWGDVTVIQ